MQETRRNFVFAITLATASLAFAQKHGTGMPKPPPPADPLEKDKKAPGPDPQSAIRARFQQNEREFRSGVDRLCQMAESLRDEVHLTRTKEVLSLQMYKRMEQIERLVKQLKSSAKG
jgi:hypothetical protein